MTTFSQLVDATLFEVKRPDMRAEIADYLNQTVREVHADPETNRIAYFKDNLVEDQVVATSDNLTWTIPNVGTFQHLLAVRFDDIWTDAGQAYVAERTPGRGLATSDRAWYRAGNYISFKGFGGNGARVSLAFYAYPRRLKYKAPADRKVTWDEESGFTFQEGLTPEQQALAMELETNWLLQRWADVIKEGLRAKVYKRVGDDSRAARCYSFFMAQRRQLFTAEIGGYGGFVE